MEFNDKNSGSELLRVSVSLPALIGQAGEQARDRFVEFFTASIRNRGTRAAYAQAVGQFLHWCSQRMSVWLTSLRSLWRLTSNN